MSTRRLALSVLLPGFLGPTVPGWLRERLAEGLAGVCLFGQNVGSAQQVAALTADLHGVRDGVLVASDEEGGSVTRLDARDGSPWPGHATLGALDDPAATFDVAVALGGAAAAVGVDLVLAPVLDVNSEPDNPVIGVRSFGATPDLVSRHGVAFVEGLARSGVLACAKHFPGHGATRTDSHVGLPVLDVDADTWRARDLAPFAAAVRAGVPAVMTAHVVVSALDDRPATLSARVLGVLRDELGFSGAVVSDALDMRAISAGVGRGEGAVLALAAGVDLLCVGNPEFPDPYDDEAAVEEVVGAVERAVADGRLPTGRLEEASARVAALAAHAGSAVAPPADPALGAAVATRALRVRGDVRVDGEAVVLVPRAPMSYAAGRADSALVTRLRSARPGWPVHDVRGPDEARAVAGTGGEVLVVVEGRPDPSYAAVVAAVLEDHPRAVVVYGGLPTPHDAGGRTVHTHGTGAATAEATLDQLLGERR
jgi:beta-N-acetylhexosaminidase